MSDDVGARRGSRRRRTTRRLARQPIRVPGDDVPRQALVLPGDDDDDDQDGDAGDVDERRSADQIDVVVDVDIGEGPVKDPTSGVVHVPSQIPPAPEPARYSKPPPRASSMPPRASESPDDGQTNPQIRLADLSARPGSLPPPPRVPEERDEPTRPRIEITPAMARAAGRITTELRNAESGDEPDVDTNPRISLPPEEPVQQAVIVTRARVISDRPSAVPETPASEQGTQRTSRRPSARPSGRPPSGEFEAIDDSLELEVGEADDNPLASASIGARAGDVALRISKAPPPPPDGPAKPVLRKPGVASAASTVPQPSVSAKAPPPPPPSASVPKKVPVKQPRRRQWWDDFFSDDYLESIPRLTPEQISRQVDFIESCLGLPKGSAVLDVGCGLGHHSLELARRGYLVVGLDLSLPMITRAAEAAQQEGLRISFLHSDIRELGFQAMFDGIVCVGTTFGFFDEEANRDALARLATALRPGGKLLLDVANRDHVVRSQPNLVWFQGEGCVVMEESDFNYFTSRLGVKRTMMREDGRQSDAEYSIRLYSLHELGQMLQQVGFRVNEVSGQEATRGIFFGGESAHIILLAERRAAKGGNGAGVGGGDEPGTGEMPRPG